MPCAPDAASVLVNERLDGFSPYSRHTLRQYLVAAVSKRQRSVGSEHRRSHDRNETVCAQDLITLLGSIARSVKEVSAKVRDIGLPGHGGVSTPDAKGAAQALSMQANKIWTDALLSSKKPIVIVSQAMRKPIIVENGQYGSFAVVFNALDGLSDPHALYVGSMFGVFHTPDSPPEIGAVMQPANKFIAAGYALYGPCTVLMLSIGDGLHQFTLNDAFDDFILTSSNVHIPENGATYCIDEAHTNEYDVETQEMLKILKVEPALNWESRECRYAGSVVTDIHRIILKGGLYMQPSHKYVYPEGRLNLLYEAGPMAFLMTQAGGKATTGTEAIIDVCPKEIQTRVPVFMGSPFEVSIVVGLYDKSTPLDNTNGKYVSNDSIIPVLYDA